MFERILLPLDGSELAETAIPYVWDLAGLGSSAPFGASDRYHSG